MGHKRITEKDFWKCTEGNMPAQLQSTQTTAKKSSGEKYITIKDTSTSSWIDFSCKKAMLIYAIIAAAAVVIAAMIVGTGGAALIALGALAGLAGAAWGAVVGALLCGQTAAKGRKWVEVPKSRMTAVQGVRQITGDCTMTCIVGGVITFDPQIKSWSQAIALGAGNYIGGLMEGMMAGAAIGMGGAALSGGAGAFASGGARGLGQAALQFAKSAPMNVLRNIGASFGYAGAGASASAAYTTAAAAVGLRGLTAAQSGLTHYGSTGESGWGAAGKGVFGMETGMYHSVNNLTTFHNPETGAFEWQGTWQDVTGLALLLSPVHKAAEEAKGKGKGEEAPAQDGEPVQDGEEVVRDTNINNETPEGQQGEHGTFEDAQRITPESFNIELVINNPELLKIFDDAVSKLANSRAKTNAYRRYIEAMNNNFDGLTRKEIQTLSEEAWSATRSKMREVATEQGVTLDGEIHHWNYPKYENPYDVLNPNQLTEPISRDLHQQIHEATTSDVSDPWGGPIDPLHAITPPPYSLPVPPVRG